MRARGALAIALWSAVTTTAAATPVPLHEIGAGPQTPAMCGNVVVHANAAIAAVLHADAVLARSIGRLRAIDFETFTAARRTGMTELARLAADVGESGDRGRDEVRRLREYVDHPAGADRSADLRAFADALDNVLDRQRRMGTDLGSFLSAVDLRDLRDVRDLQERSLPPGLGGGDPAPGARPASPASGVPPAILERERSPNGMARSMAEDLDARLGALGAEEGRAQERSEAAVSGC